MTGRHRLDIEASAPQPSPMEETAMTAPAPLNDRPRPLAEAARVWGRVVGAAGGVISALVTAGLLSTDQGSATVAAFTAVDGLVAAGVGVLAAGSALLTAFGMTQRAEPLVTPVVNPAREVLDERGEPVLVALVEAG